MNKNYIRITLFTIIVSFMATTQPMMNASGPAPTGSATAAGGNQQKGTDYEGINLRASLMIGCTNLVANPKIISNPKEVCQTALIASAATFGILKTAEIVEKKFPQIQIYEPITCVGVGLYMLKKMNDLKMK